MSNELNNIIAHNTDGVYEGVAIGERFGLNYKPSFTLLFLQVVIVILVQLIPTTFFVMKMMIASK